MANTKKVAQTTIEKTKKKEIRKIPASKQTKIRTALRGFNKNKREVIVGFLPIDIPQNEPRNLLVNIRNKIARMTELEKRIFTAQKKRIDNPMINEKLPDGNPKYSPYKVVCKNCGETVGIVWSTDEKMTEWCNFHYWLETDGDNWFGGFTPNISGKPVKDPDTGKVVAMEDWGLGMECTCGVDTRQYGSEGREFGNKNSQFILKKIKGTI